MKKIFVFILILLLLTGCQSNQNDEDKIDDQLYQQYREYYSKMTKADDFDTTIPECSVRLVLNHTNNDNLRYDVIIDQPKAIMENVKAIACVENENEFNPPSIGLLEEETFTLNADTTDKEKGIYKGINLSGITSLTDITVKVYLTFEQQDQFIERYIILYENAS